VPDPLRLARYRKAPELGPRLLFFSGGTALKKLSRRLIEYTHNSIHLVTPFDSGGSSAALREAFRMIAVGDIRNRLMALADQSVQGNPEIYRLFSYRLPAEAGQEERCRELMSMIRGEHPLVAVITDPMRKIIRNHLRFFLERMPSDFDLSNASIGNLILVGGWINNNSHIDPVIFLFSKLVEARGIVRPIVNKDLVLVGEEEDGTLLVGQHTFSRGEAAGSAKPISKVFLARNREWLEPVDVEIRRKVRDLILKAELICYPMGSLYSSVIANLLPRGVGRAVLDNDCPKVYIPNTGYDPEQRGTPTARCAETILRYLKRDLGERTPNERLLNFVVLDSRPSSYALPVDRKALEALGVCVIQEDLVTEESDPHLDEGRLLDILLSLV